MNIKNRLIRKISKIIILLTLKTEFRPCPMCANNSNFALIKKRDRYNLPIQTQKCASCGLIQIRPSPKKSFLNYFYSSFLYRGLYLGTVRAKKNSENDNSNTKAQKVLTFFNSNYILNNKKLLDIGSADGRVTKLLKNTVPTLWVYGVEPGTNFSNANSSHFTQLVSDLKEIPLELKFDFITSWHVLEHVYDPIEFLKNLSKYLAESGKIILEIPTYKKYSGIKPFHIGHMTHFDDVTIKKAVEISNLQLEKIEYDNLIDERFGMRVIISKT